MSATLSKFTSLILGPSIATLIKWSNDSGSSLLLNLVLTCFISEKLLSTVAVDTGSVRQTSIRNIMFGYMLLAAGFFIKLANIS